MHRLQAALLLAALLAVASLAPVTGRALQQRVTVNCATAQKMAGSRPNLCVLLCKCAETTRALPDDCDQRCGDCMGDAAAADCSQTQRMPQSCMSMGSGFLTCMATYLHSFCGALACGRGG